MKKIQKLEKPTLESLYTYLHESKKESKKERAEYERERAKESAEFKREMREFRESSEESNRKFRESMEESSRKSKESQERIDREMEETWKVVREVSRQLGGIGNSNGDTAEKYFQSAFAKDPRLNGEVYDTVRFNVNPFSKNGKEEAEYDIVMANGKSVAIIEIKYHFEIEKKKIKEVLSKILNKVETFKEFYPEYKNYKFYLGIASLSFRKNIEKILQEEGIAVIKQVGDKVVINSENLKTF